MRLWAYAILLIGVAGGFKKSPPPLSRFEFQHPQMGTVFRLIFYAEMDSAAAWQLATALFAEIDTLNAHFSDWLPESELNRLCQVSGTKKAVAVSEPLFDILYQSKKFSSLSHGAFDATIGPLTRLWRRSRNLKILPDSSRLAEARNRVGWQQMSLNKRRRAVALHRRGMQLDLGGIAQGWTVDFCLKWLQQRGITIALIDAGGDIVMGAAPPQTAGWLVETPGVGQNGQMVLKNCAITTSGAQFRYLDIDGVRYSHIIDPRNGQALTHHVQVTVLAPTATQADAWATAISVLGEKGWQALKHKPDIKTWISETNF